MDPILEVRWNAELDRGIRIWELMTKEAIIADGGAAAKDCRPRSRLYRWKG